jgi:D-sedoheptulose 7-phosphate isomerase
MDTVQDQGAQEYGAEALLAAAADSFAALPQVAAEVATAAGMIEAALRSGGKALFCGNGGSAADAQHLAAELLGRFLLERAPLPAMALTANSSAVTAIGNDYGFDDVFARQVRGLGRAGDVLVGISTSGRSRNVVAAFAAARERGVATIGFTGASGGPVAEAADLAIRAPAASTPRIQEMHIAIGHTLCELVERALASEG